MCYCNFLSLAGTVTDGEFCSLRSRGETRALHLWQLIHDARESVQKLRKDTLLEMLIVTNSKLLYINAILIKKQSGYVSTSLDVYTLLCLYFSDDKYLKSSCPVDQYIQVFCCALVKKQLPNRCTIFMPYQPHCTGYCMSINFTFFHANCLELTYSTCSG